MIKYLLTTAIILACQSASATPFDGQYYNDDIATECRSDYSYPIKIKNNYLRWAEAECNLTNARKINEIDAIFYFGLCMEEGDYFNAPVLILPFPLLHDRKDGTDITLVIKNRLQLDLKLCPDPAELEKFFNEEWEKFFLNDWVKNGKKG